MTDVRIRPARAGEAALLSALALKSKAHWGYDADFLARCLPLLTVSADEIAAGDVFLAERQGRICGFYGLGVEPDEAGRPVPEVAYFFVDPHTMGQGVGRALWAHLEGEVLRRGWPLLQIASDPGAEGFYLRMGAARIGERPVGVGGRALPMLEWRPARA